MEFIYKILRDNKIKITPQRVAILNKIHKSGHISVDDIYLGIKIDFPTISLATIYKNVKSLKDVGILYEIHTQNDKPKYEIKKETHAHFICKTCNDVKDIDINKDDFKIYGNIENIDLYLYGLCDNCS